MNSTNKSPSLLETQPNHPRLAPLVMKTVNPAPYTPTNPPKNIPSPNKMPRVQTKPSRTVQSIVEESSSGTGTRYVLSDVSQCVATEKRHSASYIY
ncbi:hypothetical protein ASPBRDRAFT_232608 [Aspergillus brasiliensis CBS 101740]|uniref:Uncharacterized protein n=1 Tax=Aspergillus brasiliensis (strain CBS 101740 / IMI 381727 / IBT 21946) TaxID=767769 RepID=A0A1L9UZX2_ASPBC|nr:hypothetical protein ASPBRDRAFT_232608 [Aspergillus brasiliensis CBS 101740]